MFQRRDSLKLPLDLLIDFKKTFPQSAWPALNERQDLLASPDPTLSTNTDIEVVMNFNPNHFVNQEDGTEQPDSPGNMGEWNASDVFHNQNPDFFFFNDMQTPFQQTPASSSYGPHSHFIANSVHLHDPQHAIPTPQSASAPNSAALFGHSAYINPQGQGLHGITSGYHQNYHHYPQSHAHPQGRLDYGQSQAFITPGRLDISEKNAFESIGGLYNEGSNDMRFRVTLMTGTAMVKDGELPVTYLNKCQPYKLNIKDTKPQPYAYGPITYRTFVRVSFNEQQQRDRAAHCWQLWKDGRGMTEAQQRGTKPYAVEFVPQNQGQQQASSISIQQEVFDGFCFQWTPATGRPPECEIQLRCNFLSTDFSHSKGVKGIPVRLCAKTEVFRTSQRDQASSPETCYAKVKLFRDHGAERKLSNDEAHVKKSIIKLEEQIRQAQTEHEETVMTSSGKRRQSEAFGHSGRPAKISKKMRTASVSSESTSGFRDSLDGDLQMKLAALNDTLRSKREVSILNLKGEEQDDPDKYPVKLPDSTEPPSESPANRTQSRKSTLLSAASSGSPTVAPTPIQPPGRSHPNLQAQAAFNDWRTDLKLETEPDLHSANPQHLASPPDQTPKTETRSKLKAEISHDSIEVSDLDPSYVPPVRQEPRPVACFFLRFSMNGAPPSEPYYRAVYLRERSLLEFTRAAALKRNISPDQVVETIRVQEQELPSGETTQLEIQVDDEVISDILEGQDMFADFSVLPIDLESTDARAPDLRYRLTIEFNEPLRSESYD